MNRKIDRFFLWRWLLACERIVMVFCSLAVILTIGAGVVCRYFLHINFTAKDEVLVILALWLYFIGGAEGGNYKDNHIRADVMSVFLKNEKAKRVMHVITKAISLVVSVIFAVWAYQYLKLCLKMGGRTQILKIPMLASRGALVVGYMLPVLYNVYHMIVSVQELLHPGSTDETFENPAMGGEKK